jgi:hypothetical protein
LPEIRFSFHLCRELLRSDQKRAKAMVEPMAIVTVTGGVLGPVIVLLSRIQPVVDFFRRLCNCIRHPQRRPARPLRAPWYKGPKAEE